MREDWTADGEIHVVRVKWRVWKAHEMLAGKHLLVVEVIFSRTMELVRSRPCGKHGLQTGGATIFTAECIDLNAGFLDRGRLRRKIQYALADSAGYVQAINNVLVIVLALTVRAGVNLF